MKCIDLCSTLSLFLLQLSFHSLCNRALKFPFLLKSHDAALLSSHDEAKKHLFTAVTCLTSTYLFMHLFKRPQTSLVHFWWDPEAFRHPTVPWRSSAYARGGGGTIKAWGNTSLISAIREKEGVKESGWEGRKTHLYCEIHSRLHRSGQESCWRFPRQVSHSLLASLRRTVGAHKALVLASLHSWKAIK